MLRTGAFDTYRLDATVGMGYNQELIHDGDPRRVG
jgi:hypothetical protein